LHSQIERQQIVQKIYIVNLLYMDRVIMHWML